MSFYSTGEFEHMFGYSVVVDKTAEKGVPGECIGRVGQTSAFQLENSSECAVKVELLRSFRDPHSTSPCQVRRSDRRRRRPDRHAVPRDRSRAVAPTGGQQPLAQINACSQDGRLTADARGPGRARHWFTDSAPRSCTRVGAVAYPPVTAVYFTLIDGSSAKNVKPKAV
jgi:hypothetical protein